MTHYPTILEGNSDKVPGRRLSFRTDAIKELIFVTDDDASAITSDKFRKRSI